MAAAELAFGVFFVAGSHGGFFRFDFRACGGFRFGCWRGGGCGCCCRSCWSGWWRWSFWSCVGHSIRSCVYEFATSKAESKDSTQRTQSKTGEHRDTGTALRSCLLYIPYFVYILQFPASMQPQILSRRKTTPRAPCFFVIAAKRRRQLGANSTSTNALAAAASSAV